MADYTGSVTLYDGTSGQYQIVLSVWEKSTNVVNNSSNVGWSVKIKSVNGYYSFWGLTCAWKVVINGATVYNASKSLDVNANSTVSVASGTTTVYHSNDGSKTISSSLSFSQATNTGGYSPKSGSCSGSLKLTTIPRATTPSLDLSKGSAFGNTITVKGTSASSSFNHKIFYQVSGESTWNHIGDIGSGSTSVSKTWTIPTSLMNKIPNATSMKITVNLDTYSGSTKIGVKSVAFTATVPSNVVPSISSVSVAEAVSGIASTFGYYIQGKSKLAFTVSAAGTYSSFIKSITGNVNGTGYTASSGKFTTGTINKSGNVSYSVTATDSRGRTVTKTGTVNMVAYANPSVTGTVQRANNTYEVDEQEGIYALVNFSYNILPLDDKNTKGFILQYRESTSNTWVTLNEWTEEYSLTDEQYEAGNLLESTKAYQFRFGAMDYFNPNYIYYYTDISPTYTLMNFRNTGRGIAFGGQSEDDNFTSNMDTVINANQVINGKLEINRNSVITKYAVSRISTNNNSDYLKNYIKLFQVNITSEYVNYPINAEIRRRDNSGPIKLAILFKNSNTLDPAIAGFYKMNADVGHYFYLVKEASGQWGCYFKRSSDNYDWIIIDKFTCNNNGLYTIDFFDSDLGKMYCTDTLPSSTYTEATEYYTPFYKTATTSSSGLMSASDKSKLDGIAAGANKFSLTVDSSLSTSSTNPVQNKQATNAIIGRIAYANANWGKSLTAKNVSNIGILLVSGNVYGVWPNGSGNDVMLYHPGTNSWSSSAASVSLQGVTCKRSGTTLTFTVSSNAGLHFFYKKSSI